MKRKSNRLMTGAPLAAALSLGAMVLGASGIVLAAPASTPASNEIVHYNDLNLSTPSGVQELASRIQNAAWQVCMDVAPPAATGPSNIANAQCQQTVVKETVDKVNNPALSSMFPAAPTADDNLSSD
ncbi:MAG TPA: UrcA family protein [Steroidobacteraceae bacterium]|jgi:UrcA family protein